MAELNVNFDVLNLPEAKALVAENKELKAQNEALQKELAELRYFNPTQRQLQPEIDPTTMSDADKQVLKDHLARIGAKWDGESRHVTIEPQSTEAGRVPLVQGFGLIEDLTAIAWFPTLAQAREAQNGTRRAILNLGNPQIAKDFTNLREAYYAQ